MHILHSGCAKMGTLAAMAALVSSSVMAALPQPVFPAKDGASAVSLDAISASEFSIAFWAKYDRIPSVGSPTGLYDFSVAKDGTVTVTLFAKPTEFQGDLVFTSKDKVKKGEWNHFELTYTLEQKRVAFYMNGRLQWENDNLFLPKLRFNGETGPTADFRGEVRDFRLFDAPLANEYLAIAQNVAASIDEIMVIADGALKDCKNGALSAWVQSLKKEAENLKANPDVVTMGQVKDLKRDVLNASLIADEAKGLADQRKVFGAGFTLFDVPPLSQTPVLNYSVPKNGKLATEMRIALSPGEYENGSVVAFSFKPLTLTEVRFDNFTGPDKAVIPASSIDIKLVKRWYRSGGAWLSYHNDHRQRNITPDLLVNDDNLIKVDEHKRANFLRLDYPNGTIYANSSEAERGHISWQNKYPFQDAATLQPFTFKKAGCNQQYLFTFHAPKGTKPGLYKSELIVKSTDGMCRVPVTMSVLPIDLPELPSSYDNLDRSYISHMNHLATGEIGATLEKRKAYYEKQLKNLRAHNMNHTTHIWNSPELIKMSLDAGFIPDRIFGTVLFDRSNPKAWYEFFPGIRRSELTSKDKENGLRAVMRNAEK